MNLSLTELPKVFFKLSIILHFHFQSLLHVNESIVYCKMLQLIPMQEMKINALKKFSLIIKLLQQEAESVFKTGTI